MLTNGRRPSTFTHTTIRRRLAALLIPALAAACSAQRDTSAPPRLSWRIIDSSWVTPWDEATDSMAVYRVGIVARTHVDTLTDILPPWPVIVDDSTVWGLRKVPGHSDRELFRWSIPAKRMRTMPLPDDVLDGYVDLSHARWVTPDSFEIAAVSSSTGRGWAISSGSAAARRASLAYSPVEPDWHTGPRP